MAFSPQSAPSELKCLEAFATAAPGSRRSFRRRLSVSYEDILRDLRDWVVDP